MKKAIGKIHLWLGLGSGLVVFIIASTGCTYVFEEELKAWLYEDRETVASWTGHSTHRPLHELLIIAETIAGKDHPIQTVEIQTAANSTYVFRPEQIRNPKAYTHFGEIVYQHKLYLNPYTGELVKDENTKFEFFTVVLRLHRNLLLNRSIGTMIIGISVLVFVVMLVTGIVLWWPKNKFSLKKAISFKWKDTTRWKRKNYDLHNVLGFYSFFIVLIIALTGLTWSFDWFDNSVQWIANGGEKAKKSKPLFSDTTQVGAHASLDKILFQLATSNPQAHTFNINLPTKPNGVINASVRNDNTHYTSQRYQFDQYTGKMLTTAGFKDKNTGEKLKAMNYDIHVGAILGLPGKILAFFASLVAASLPVTGFFIWWGRTRKSAKTEKKSKATSLSARSTKKTRPVYHKQALVHTKHDPA